MEKLEGYVDHIVFRNDENGYTVLDLNVDGEAVTCVGIFHSIEAGASVCVSGEYSVHPSYGEQFRVTSYELTAPKDREAVERYLGSGAIKGVGPVMASRIVQRFGDDTFRIIEEEPERLAEIKGISSRKARDIAVQAAEKRDLRDAMIYLQQFGISMALSVKIYRAYGADMYQVIRTNPYKLADDISGVGFKLADQIARRAGIRADSDFRIRSGILYVLFSASLQGHTYLPQEELTQKTSSMLEVDPEAVEKCYMDMTIDHKLILREKDGVIQIYSSAYYYLEANAAYMLTRLNQTCDVDEEELKADIRMIEKESEIHLDDLQITAVQAAAENGLLVITGGPGTGKTTTINAIIRYFDSRECDILLAAPTGRAAKKMSEATGYEARTIHRMLEINGGVEDNAGFERNEDNPLEADVIIIDEMSMVDISLMNALLRAVVPGTKLILVGDANQLPSVGAGSVLRDIIDSKICTTVRLTRIFRQASRSDIIVNAHKINRGEKVILDNRSRDFFFLKRYDANVIISICIQLIRDKLPGYVGAKPYEIQLLTPMRKGLLGVERLNVILQQYLNPPAKDRQEYQHGSGIFREGDKVMQIRNNYQLEWNILSRYGIPVEKGVGIFNGDMGIIRTIDPVAERVTVEFDEERMVEYEFQQLDELELSYAITIHKSQGSEYPAVVIPLLTGPRMLLNRNLLYTAVTRARKCVVMVGDEKTFQMMVDNVSEQTRYSGLKDRLLEEQKNREE